MYITYLFENIIKVHLDHIRDFLNSLIFIFSKFISINYFLIYTKFHGIPFFHQ